jgi:hypothetical protein
MADFVQSVLQLFIDKDVNIVKENDRGATKKSLTISVYSGILIRGLMLFAFRT